MKFIGAVLIISGSVFVGMYFLRQLKRRSNVLSDILLSLTALHNEISFGRSSLEDAFSRLSRIKGDTGDFYYRCCEGMKAIPKIEFEKLWRDNVILLFEPIIFSKNEKEVMLTLGSGLGSADSDSQVRSLRYASEELSRLKEDAFEEERKKSKMYMGLSMIAAAVVIIAAV